MHNPGDDYLWFRWMRIVHANFTYESINFSRYHLSPSVRKPTILTLNRSDTNQAVQLL